MSGEVTRTLLVSVILGAAGSVTYAQGVGPGGPFEGSYVFERAASFPEDPITWLARVGRPSNPIAVALDPAGPAWVKHFDPPNNSPILPGETIALSEALLVSGNLPWTSWQESVVTPGFDWVRDAIAGLFAYGTVTPLPGLAAWYAPPSGGGPTVGLSFDQVGAGATIMIGTTLVYTGSAPFYGSITVGQFPTPEPATLGFVAIGVLGAVRRRAKKTGKEKSKTCHQDY